MWIALPYAAHAEGSQLDKMRAKISSFISDKMENFGGSRIVYKVDTDGLRESIVTDLRNNVYQDPARGQDRLLGLAIRDAGVEVEDCRCQGPRATRTQARISSRRLPSRALAVTDGGDGAGQARADQCGTPLRRCTNSSKTPSP